MPTFGLRGREINALRAFQPRVAEVGLAVENQLAENNPPQVAWTLERLLVEGIQREEALKYIACALSVEIFQVLKHGATYDEARYLRNLARLPELPWEDEQEI